MATLVAGLATAHRAAAEEVQNPISAFAVNVDGLFTDGVSGGSIIGEWSDVTPLAFISPPTNAGTLLRTSLTDPNRNSLLYAAISAGAAVNENELYLMYDYLPRTNPVFLPGEFIADVSFPISNIPGFPPQQRALATVHFQASSILASEAADEPQAAISPVNIFVTVEGHQGAFAPEQLGMRGAVDFGPSTLSTTPHLLVELQVSLNVPPGFLGPNKPGGNGVYSPDPAFWGSNASNDLVDPPSSGAIFQILPGGTVVANSDGIVPEPATGLLAAFAGVAALAAGRKARKNG